MLQGTEENPNKYYYEYANGIKTGSHSQSGWCFAGAASKDGVDLVSVVMFTGKRNPSRDTVIKLAFAMRADVAQTQEMLKIARKSVLYPRIKRDTVIIYCLHNHISLVDTELILEDLDLPNLGGRDK